MITNLNLNLIRKKLEILNVPFECTMENAIFTKFDDLKAHLLLPTARIKA